MFMLIPKRYKKYKSQFIFDDMEEEIDFIQPHKKIPYKVVSSLNEQELREEIAQEVADKMDYMGTCLNERNIILGIITGKREHIGSLCDKCWVTDCKNKE